MPRDPKKLQAFVLADNLVLDVYRASKALPIDERYGLQAQLRRAAVSVPTNLVEGCARRGETDYLRFVEIAYSSACEAAYLIGLAVRLEYLTASAVARLLDRYDHLKASLYNLMAAIDPSR